jgi:hypothetical protein
MKIDNTLFGLRQRIAHYERLSSLARQAASMLEESSLGVVYEVYIQSSVPHERPVMRKNASLQIAIDEAKELWKKLHPGYEFRKEVEVFARQGDVRVAIDPRDLGEGFTLDKRIADHPNQMAFNLGDKLPSCWYASSQTDLTHV